MDLKEPTVVSLADDMLAEGEPEKEFNPGIASRIPRKRVAAGVLFRDEEGRILVVEPRYKPTLEIPGGITDDDEFPLRTCMREVTEELGLSLPIGDLLVVDSVPRHGVWPDGILFIFDGGLLTEEESARIRLPADELASFKFLSIDEIAPRVRSSMARRLRAALDAVEAGRPLYLEFGRKV